MQPVRAVCAAGHDAVREDHRLTLLRHGHVVIAHARQHFSQFQQLVIVAGKEGFGAQLRMVVHIFHNRPRERESVVGAGAAPDFVQNE